MKTWHYREDTAPTADIDQPGPMEPTQAQADRAQAHRDTHAVRLQQAWNPAPRGADGALLARPRSYAESKIAAEHAYKGDAAVSAALDAHRRTKGSA